MTLSQARERAIDRNLELLRGAALPARLLCPQCRQALDLSASVPTCPNGHRVPMVNGIPDLTDLNAPEPVREEKTRQAVFHDDESGNEPFEEIVRRPFDGGPIHVRTWLHHLHRFERILPARLGMGLNDATILNCGCGGGFEAQYFAERGARVVGFDISQLRAEASATRFCERGLDGVFYRGDAANLPFDDAVFDLVVYHDSLHHVPIEEIPGAIREAVRVARKGVVLLEPHDSILRLGLETFGLSTSIEPSGNYVFRFRKSLLQFWARQTETDLVDYSIWFTKKEHRPRIYALPIAGPAIYGAIRALSVLLNPIGNEACIILKKRASNLSMPPTGGHAL